MPHNKEVSTATKTMYGNPFSRANRRKPAEPTLIHYIAGIGFVTERFDRQEDQDMAKSAAKSGESRGLMIRLSNEVSRLKRKNAELLAEKDQIPAITAALEREILELKGRIEVLRAENKKLNDNVLLTYRHQKFL